MKHKLILSFAAILLVSMTACKKYLDEKPDPTQAIPSSLSDLQSLLDSYNSMNQKFPTTKVMLSDDYYVLEKDLNSVTNAAYRNQYNWQPDESSFSDWNNVYVFAVKNANVVLDNIAMVANPSNTASIKTVKASALFYRAFYLYECAQLFGQPYNASTSGTDLGIVLRLDGDFNKVSFRSSVAETYNQILKDLIAAANDLPERQGLKTRPTKAAAYGTLARVYLTMSDFPNAGKYADSCIKSYGPDSLLDYNKLSATAAAPFKRFNSEVIFHCVGPTNTLLANSRAKIDSNLYASYAANDLRKKLFFKSNNNGTYQFKGDYNGSGTSTGYAFGGIVLDEVYLIRSEARARQNQLSGALDDLNKLLKTRWVSGTYGPITATDLNTALTNILRERRKELIFRGTRWSDLRRLKDDAMFTVTPKRIIGNQVFQLMPANPRYTLKIPAAVINSSAVTQNP